MTAVALYVAQLSTRSTGSSRGSTRSRSARRRSRGSSASPRCRTTARRPTSSPATSGSTPTTFATRTPRARRAARHRPAARAGRAGRHGRPVGRRASRRSAGCWPGIHPPRTGTRRRSAASGSSTCPLDTLRGHVALVTQEHHVFVGTIEENLKLARPARGRAAARGGAGRRRRARLGRARCRSDCRPSSARADCRSHPRRRSSSRSPGSCSPTRTRSSSTRRPRSSTRARPATSSARWPSVLDGRTVIAIAHRLHTAHDADRVAVVDDGLLEEIGTHDELVSPGRLLRRALGLVARRTAGDGLATASRAA